MRPGEFSHPPRTGVTIALCFLVALIEGFDIQAAGMAAPRMAPALGLSPEALGLFFSASTLGMLFGAYGGGRLSDRVGRKPVLLGAVACFGIFSILTGMAGSIETLVAMRLLTGVGLGAALPALIALAAESDPDRATRAVALMYAGTPLGGAIVGIASAMLPSWQAIFVVGGLLPIIVLPVLALFLAESHRPGGEAGGIAPVREIFAEGRGGTTALLWMSFFACLLVLYLMLNWTPLLLAERNFTKDQIALFQAVLNIVGGLAVLFSARLLDGRRRIVLAVMAYGGTVAALAALSLIPPMLVQVLVVASLLGAGLLTAQSIMYGTAPLVYPEAIRGTGVGAAVAVGRLGSIAGPIIGGAVLGAGLAPAVLTMAIIPFVLIAGVGNVLILRRLASRA